MNNKDVIYVDVEDEITNVIDKVNTSKSKVVALVLPKRATVFQSVVNMKLLKKKSVQAKKSVILVTSEAGLLPLAGAVGMHVAKSLQAKPEIPPNPNIDDLDEGPVNLEDGTDDEEDEIPLDSKKPIGELAGLAAVGAVASKRNEPEDTIQIDNDTPADPMGLSEIDKDAKPSKDKKSKKDKKAKGLNGKPTKVPDFNKFRRNLLIGAGIFVLLILFYIIGFRVLPKAKIIVQTNTSAVNSNLSLTLSQADGNLDPVKMVVPAKFQTSVKTATSTSVNTTGTKTIGTAATGSVTVTNGGSSSDTNIPSGTVFVNSGNGQSYSSTSVETLPGCVVFKNNCLNTKTVSIPVAAAAVGNTYNSDSASYTSSDGDINGFKMSGTAMAGGSSNNVQVVAAADISSAQGQIAAPNAGQIKQQLESSLSSAGYMPLVQTYVAGAPINTPSAPLGAQANSITVTQSVTYSMYGAKQSDLNTLVKNNVNKQIDPSSQSILGTGVSTANFTVVSTTPASAQVTMQASATVGPKLDAATITTQSAGQKSGDIKSTISQIPGVTNVTIKYSPFWVTQTPKNVKKITVVIEKANGSQP